MSDANKEYVAKQIHIARTTTSQAIRNDAIYRAGTQMEITPCTGEANLSASDQQQILDAADEFLGE